MTDGKQKILEWVLAIVGATFLMGLVAIVVLEWAAGCGESWVQADGSRVVGECIFIGRW